MSCVIARDRLDCITKLQHHEADFETVDPEDMFIALQKGNNDFSIFKEIRTKEEPEAEFRYEAVVVIHKDLEINTIQGLRGLKSCHTGVARNVGYKIPITKLTKMGILGPLSDTKISPRENELKALSTFFSKSCLVGKWSPDNATNQRLKSTYNNLCQLCEFPDKCDYPDQNSGYEGALRCLTKGGGDVAFTKVIFVKKYFGMAYGTQPAKPSEYDPKDYVYLCPDASKKPITGPACSWAARPWQGYMASSDVNNKIKELREQISKLNNLGESTHADWITSVLALNDKTLAVDNAGPYSPQQYLEKAKYVDVIERDVLAPRRTVRFCVTNSVEKAKCEDLTAAAYSRDIRPGFSCVQKANIEECMSAVKNKDADIISVDPGHAPNALKKFNLEPVVAEEYSDDHKQYAVAVVKKSSSYQSLSDLKEKKACLSQVGEAAGWVVPVYNLLKQNLIEKTNCPYTKALAEYFSAGKKYSSNPFQCLVSGEGEVAFTDYDSVRRSVDEGEHAEGKKSSDYELLCGNGGRAALSEYKNCKLGHVPPRVLLASKELSTVERDDILFAVLAAGDLYHKHPEYFDLYGTYQGHPDVLFSNSASGLETVTPGSDIFQEYNKLVDELKACTPSETKP